MIPTPHSRAASIRLNQPTNHRSTAKRTLLVQVFEAVLIPSRPSPELPSTRKTTSPRCPARAKNCARPSPSVSRNQTASWSNATAPPTASANPSSTPSPSSAVSSRRALASVNAAWLICASGFVATCPSPTVQWSRPRRVRDISCTPDVPPLRAVSRRRTVTSLYQRIGGRLRMKSTRPSRSSSGNNNSSSRRSKTGGETH